MAAKQYPLALVNDASLRPEDYIITESNQEITESLQRVPNGQIPVVVVLGASGSGKSHLLSWLAAQRPLCFVDAARVGEVPAETWMPDANMCYAVDDAHTVRSQAALAQAINHARATATGLLLTMDSGFSASTPDLVSRLNAAHRLHMSAPDDTLMRALLIKRFADLQWRCDSAVAEYVLTRIPRDVASLHRFVELADREGLAQKRALTVPFAAHIITILEDKDVSGR